MKKINPRVIRAKRAENQVEFWSRVSVSQSSGSRFESGMPMPRPVQTLFQIAYGTQRERNDALRSLGVTVKDQ